MSGQLLWYYAAISAAAMKWGANEQEGQGNAIMLKSYISRKVDA